VVAHVVLFELRPGLTADDRQRFTTGFTRALETIPSVRRVTVGRRTSLGASYEKAGERFEYLAVLDFDDESGLRQYLEHPAHAELAALFWACTARTLVSDFQLAGNDLPLALASWASQV
jgi:Stress responsive A/B Barrel Domain